MHNKGHNNANCYRKKRIHCAWLMNISTARKSVRKGCSLAIILPVLPVATAILAVLACAM